MNDKKIKFAECEQCNNEEDLISFGLEKYRCSECMRVDGLCQECGDYIPMPDHNNEDDPLYQLDDSSDFAPNVCLECYKKNNL